MKEKTVTAKPSLLDFLRLLKSHKLILLMAVLLSLFSSVASIIQPVIVSKIIDSFTSGIDIAILMILVTTMLVSSGLSAIKQYLLEIVSEGLVLELRTNFIKKSLRFKISIFDENKIGNLASILSSDTAQLRGILSQGVVELVSQSFTMIVALIMMIYLDFQLFAMSIIAVLLLFVSGIMLGKKTRPVAEDLQKSVGDLSAEFERTVRGIRTIRTFRAEDIFENRMFDVAHISKNVGKKVAVLKSIVSGFSSIALQIMLLSVIGMGALRVEMGVLTVGTLSAFIMYVMLVLTPAAMLGGVISSIYEGLGSLSRIQNVLDFPVEEEVELEDTTSVNTNNIPLVIENVNFSYKEGGFPVLRDVSLKVPKGEITAIVGPSGTGKSTVFELIERFYEINKGEIRVFGRNIQDFPLSVLRSQITMVEQNSSIFSGTVRDNLLIANKFATDMELFRALETVNLFQDIAKNEVLNKQIGELGVTLSGGERQRLALARAFISHASIILLDEATSNLDSINESKIQEAIQKMLETKTIFIIAHRLSTIKHAHTIYILKDGIILGSGSHQSLLEVNDYYRELVHTQFLEVETL